MVTSLKYVRRFYERECAHVSLKMADLAGLFSFNSKGACPNCQGLGVTYTDLGQPLSTLSGGECQRIKIASELHKRGSIYVMDEPTTGLHLSDIGRLLTIMNRLVIAATLSSSSSTTSTSFATPTRSSIWDPKAPPATCSPPNCP